MAIGREMKPGDFSGILTRRWSKLLALQGSHLRKCVSNENGLDKVKGNEGNYKKWGADCLVLAAMAHKTANLVK